MKLRSRLGLGALAGLLIAALLPASAGAQPSAPPPGAGGPYRYSASFKVDVNYGIRTDWGSDSIDLRKLSATVSGTIADVEVQDTYRLVQHGGKSSVRVEQAAAETTATRNDGEFVNKCNGSKAIARGPSWIEPGEVPWLSPFTVLRFPVSCNDTESGPGTGEFRLDRIVAYKWDARGKPGDDTIVYKVYGDATDPEGPFDCPDMVEEFTTSCAYTIKGTVTLKLLKQGPAKNTASLSKGATKATAKTMCPMRCTIDITVKTLDGKVPVTLVHLKQKPRKKTTTTIPIPANKRSLVQQSGGITMKLDYEFEGGLTYSEVRRVLL